MRSSANPVKEPPLPSWGTWILRYDHKVDGAVVTHSHWELQLEMRNGKVSGRVLSISDGKESDSILSGEVIRPTIPIIHGESSVSVLVLRQDTSDRDYFKVYTARRASATGFVGTWVDAIGQIGDFTLTQHVEE